MNAFDLFFYISLLCLSLQGGYMAAAEHHMQPKKMQRLWITFYAFLIATAGNAVMVCIDASRS